MDGDAEICARLRKGDESAFVWCIDTYGATMLRIARAYVGDDATAEEVVQDAWLGVLAGIDGFEGRSSLKSWMFAIVVHKAKTRGVREKRSLPFSALAQAEAETNELALAPSRFRGRDEPWPGHWRDQPTPLAADPEAHALSDELIGELGSALATLPEAQRAVVTLRDVAGHSGEEVGHLLGLSESNVRVLLHRGRSKLRSALERYVREEAALSA